MTTNQINRITEAQMTRIVQRAFGSDFYALARRGRRDIVQRTGLCCDSVFGDTWVEALAQAQMKWAPVASVKS